jgi:transcriptional regulator with XRE-family HTH domain
MGGRVVLRVQRLTAQGVTRRLGARVIELRRRLDLTQEALAELVGCSARVVQRIEAGQVNLNLERLVQLANGLGVDLPGLLSPPTVLTKRRPGRPRKP